MKILQIMAGAPTGGAEIFFVDAITALQQKNIKQFVITRPDNHQRIAQIEALNIPHKTASFNKIISWPTKNTIHQAIRNFKPDIVQYWMGRAASFAVEGNHINIGWYGAYYNIKRYQKCNYHIGVTQAVTDHIITQGISTEKAFTLPIYTHPNKATPVSRKSLATPEDVPLLLCLARLHPVKGIDTLLKAMSKVPEAYLWLAGSGPLEDDLKKLANDLNLNDRVRFLGWRKDKEALMAASDICAFPSRTDSFGAVMIEAWASRKPFVATKAPGPRAYVTNEKDGLLVDIDNVEQLAEAINRVISDSTLRENLVKNGYDHYEREFTQEKYCENALKIYRSLLGRK